MAKTANVKVIIYARFSPRRNSADCESCETQRQQCQEFAQKAGWQVVGYYEDKAISGAEADRPGLWAAIAELKKGNVLLVYRADRLARDVYLSECIRRAVDKAGARIATVAGGIEGDQPEDKMVRQILAAFAEYERKIIALRTKYAMLAHQRAGKRMSRYAPYGYQLDPANNAKLVADPIEQRAIARIRELAAAGVNYTVIARELNQSGYPARAGRWNHRAIARILNRNI